MGVTNVNSNAAQAPTYNAAYSKPTEQNAAADKTEDKNEKDKNNGFINDIKYTPDMDKVNSMMKDAESKMSSFINTIEKLILKQGSTFRNVFDAVRQEMFEVDEKTRLEAEEAVSEDGYYGVKKTSERIFDFAVAISGGDPSKIEDLRKAVEKGFEEAEKVWGDKLPEISQQTYDAVMKKFDDWAEEAKNGVAATAK